MAQYQLESTEALIRKDIPTFKAGDTIVVRSKIKEGEKERIQAFEGVVLARRGAGVAKTFTIRKVSSGIGVERIFPVNSPSIVDIEVKTVGFVRRARLNYLKELEGRKARIKDKTLKLSDAHGASKSKKTK